MLQSSWKRPTLLLAHAGTDIANYPIRLLHLNPGNDQGWYLGEIHIISTINMLSGYLFFTSYKNNNICIG